jgi:Cu-processing system permease protein
MTTATITQNVEYRIVSTIARKELRDAVRNKWFWLYAIGFAGLAGVLTTLALPSARIAGYGAFGRSASSLIALVQLIIPLMGLTLGALALAGQHERGTIRFLLGHPISRSEAFLGIYVGLATAMFATISAGFGAAGVMTVMRGGSADAGAFVRIALLSWLLAAAMLGVGLLVSAFTDRSGVASGSALFVWLGLVFLGDLGIMGTALATNLPVNVLFFSAVANPVEAFRLATLSSFQGSLDVLGPAGSYAVDRFGDGLDALLIGILVLWVIVPTSVAWFRFTRSKDL